MVITNQQILIIFLQLVDEAKYLTTNGITTLFNEIFQFKINMLFDAVAKSSVLYIKGHSGYTH